MQVIIPEVIVLFDRYRTPNFSPKILFSPSIGTMTVILITAG